MGALMTENSQEQEKAKDTPLPTPPAVEQDWATKIERAKEARESGQKIREGKPVSFPVRRVRP
jgi:hypothetical protein